MLKKGTTLYSYFDKEIKDSLILGKVIKRPSASIKSPYMADVKLLTNTNTNKPNIDTETIIIKIILSCSSIRVYFYFLVLNMHMIKKFW